MAKEVRTTTFRITRQGANHYGPPEGKNHERKRYGYGDNIVLPYDAGTDPKYNNLGLVNANGVRDVAAEEAELGQERANPAVDPGAGNIGTGEDGGTQTDDATKEGNANDAADEGNEKDPDKAKVEALIDELEDSSGAGELAAIRQKVIDADLFEEGTVPTKKAELMQALIDYRDAE